MNIGFDAKRLFNNFTGLGNYSRFVVEALIKNFPEHTYTLFSPKVRRHPDTDFFFNKPDVNIITPSETTVKFKLGSLWRTFGISGAVKKHKVQLYHGLSHELPRALPYGVKKVVTIHDLIFYRYPQFYNPIDVAIYKSKVKHATHVADHIVAISEQTRQDVIEFLKIDPAKVSVVYQGCHQNFKRELASQDLEEVKKKYGLPSKYILNVGTIEPRKNALLIVKALGQIDQKVKLVIVGRPTSYLDEVQKYVQDKKLMKRVLFIHKADFADLPAIYSMADVFVYPSLFEGFGIPLVEAITCKVPVITSTGSCFREAAGPSAVYVDTSDHQTLALEINQIVDNPQVRTMMVSESLEYIRKFEPEVIANDMMRVYQS